MPQVPATSDQSNFHASISSVLKIGNKPNEIDIPLKAQYPSENGLIFELDAHDVVLKVDAFADWLEGEPFYLKSLKSMLGELTTLEVLINRLLYSNQEFALEGEIQGNESNPNGEIKLIQGISLSNIKFNIDYAPKK